MNYALWETDWGHFGIVLGDAGILATYLPHDEVAVRKRIDREWPEATEGDVTSTPRWSGFREQVLSYFAGESVTFDVPVDLATMPAFRQRVLRACAEIPYGESLSYAGLAKRVGSPHAARAVGGAMASNPAPLVIPCHRVLRADGSLGGFSGPTGVRLKAKMLRLEASHDLSSEATLFQPSELVCS
ncbi:MAG: methylated-DNA--[protein]-cysteine S-methyltransferase [Phycisphaerae bacterium]